jgi:pilus assembly protein CpaB
VTSLIEQVPEPLRAVLRAASWHRRLLAAVCAAAAVAFALSAVAPGPPAVVRVLAAARDVPAGTTLTTADVHTIALPPAAVPAGALRAGSDVAGRVVAGAMHRNETVTDVRLVGTPMFAALPAGLVATPLRIADPGVARLLQPGDVVDVLASSEHTDTAPAVALGVRVLAVPSAADTSTGLDDGALVVLATTATAAGELAHAAVTSRLTVVIRNE